MDHYFPVTRCASCFWSIAIVVCLFSANGMEAGKLPPAPSRPELTETRRNAAIDALDSEVYAERKQANDLLQLGGVDTVRSLREQIDDLDAEGRIRALGVAQHIYLSALSHQNDDDAAAIRDLINELRLADNQLLGSRVDMFDTIHRWAIERASVRKLIRLNMVIEFQQANRAFPGLAKRDITSELPQRLFIGDNWQGDEDDLRHIEFLLLLGEQQLGSQRAIYRIDGCPIPLSKLQDMAAGLQVQVAERGRARLGVGARPQLFVDNPPWEVTEVSPGSAAAHAGIEVGDTIVRLNSESLNTFEELISRLEHFEPADVVTIDVISRDAMPVAVTFDKPLALDEIGVTIDNEFERFTIIGDVQKDSQAAEAGFSEMLRVDRINGQAVNGPHNFRLIYTMQNPEKPVTLEMRKIKRLPVTLRSWVGAYR